MPLPDHLYEPRKIETWHDVTQRFDEFFATGKQWAFRGHTSCTWSLRTTFERALLDIGHPNPLTATDDDLRALLKTGLFGKNAALLEQRLVDEFRRRYHHYSLDAPGAEPLEWYATMRHHGAPVRLLDFSYSLFVGLFFALEDAQGSCDVWAVDTDWVAQIADRARATTAPRFVRPLNPFRLSPRHVVQQGIFLSQKDIGATFEDNLASMAALDSDAGMKAALVRMTVTGVLDVRND